MYAIAMYELLHVSHCVIVQKLDTVWQFSLGLQLILCLKNVCLYVLLHEQWSLKRVKGVQRFFPL